MTTISVDIDESVETFIRNQDIPLYAYLWKLIKEDMLQKGVHSRRANTAIEV